MKNQRPQLPNQYAQNGSYLATKQFDLPLFLATLAAGLVAWFLDSLLYKALIHVLARPLLIAILFFLLVLIVSLTVLVVSKLENGFDEEFLFLTSTGAIAAGLAVLLVLSFLLALVFEWIYDREERTISSATSYIFLLDESGSMSGSDPDQLRYDAINQVLATQPDGFPYAVYVFANDTQLVRDMASSSEGSNYTIPDVGGSTYMKAALTTILDDYRNGVWSGGTAPKVVLLTDGAASDISFFSSIDSLLSDYVKSGISISTVGLGAVDQSLLNNIAQKTGGVFVPVEQAGSLASGMQQAAYGVANRDLFSARVTPGRDLLYGILRVVFLFLLGALLAFTKAMACARMGETPRILIFGGAFSLLGALIMELGTLAGLPAWPCWLLLWLLLAATPAMLTKQHTTHVTSDVHSNMSNTPNQFNSANVKPSGRSGPSFGGGRRPGPGGPGGGSGSSFLH
ncbi:VWA domain-containing protein [Pseudoflavonifractor phocaeensis]|uniref:VWA domain-containing protein n=1 Tax=Pseudoflavonifractor phocaeensis TaxID=1870988 RepID=UPI001955F803|nr:vWA domain-containing protein [Pseudoflavonifractor phocaeensis]MBM6871321.1 VWA domain-containing protein [Pseudoflavonifractor phocaeensis]